MAQSWIDTHAHLADEALSFKTDEVLTSARQLHVDRILSVAVDYESSQSCLQLAKSPRPVGIPMIWASVGIHPNHVHLAQDGDWDRIVALAENSQVVALGETGLDRHWDDCPFELQQNNFGKHWVASRELGLPVIVHMRDCEADMLSFLREQVRDGQLQGVMHSYAGSLAAAQEFVSMGLYISFSGILTYKKNHELRSVVRSLPIDRILVETDCPYLSPEPHRSVRPNQPSMVVHTARVVADAVGKSLDELSQITTENALRLFHRML